MKRVRWERYSDGPRHPVDQATVDGIRICVRAFSGDRFFVEVIGKKWTCISSHASRLAAKRAAIVMARRLAS